MGSNRYKLISCFFLQNYNTVLRKIYFEYYYVIILFAIIHEVEFNCSSFFKHRVINLLHKKISAAYVNI